MANKVEIANSALSKIGGKPILSFDDAVKSARLIKIRYPHCKKAVLRSHVWNFAKHSISLSPLSETPPYNYSQAYQLPSDFIRVALVNGRVGDKTYDIQGRKIFTNEGVMELDYIRDVDEGYFDALCSEALALYLAWDICYPLVQDLNLKDMQWRDYLLILKQAKSINGQENAPRVLEASTLLESRLIGTNRGVPATSSFPTGLR